MRRDRVTTRPAAAARAGRRAFSLVELLVVLVIIGILAAVLVPTLRTVMGSANETETAALQTALANGARMYYKEHDNTYPGQAYLDRVGDDGGTWDEGRPELGGDSVFTGTQWLAISLFTPKGGYVETGYPATDYGVEHTASNLMTYQDEDGNRYPETFRDGFGEPLPICYYPSRAFHKGLTADGEEYEQFELEDNVAYTREHTLAYDREQTFTQADFSRYLASPEDPADGDPAETVPPGDGSFLLLSPGKDRKYFTKDDIRTNF